MINRCSVSLVQLLLNHVSTIPPLSYACLSGMLVKWRALVDEVAAVPLCCTAVVSMWAGGQNADAARTCSSTCWHRRVQHAPAILATKQRCTGGAADDLVSLR